MTSDLRPLTSPVILLTLIQDSMIRLMIKEQVNEQVNEHRAALSLKLRHFNMIPLTR